MMPLPKPVILNRLADLPGGWGLSPEYQNPYKPNSPACTSGSWLRRRKTKCIAILPQFIRLCYGQSWRFESSHLHICISSNYQNMHIIANQLQECANMESCMGYAANKESQSEKRVSIVGKPFFTIAAPREWAGVLVCL